MKNANTGGERGEELSLLVSTGIMDLQYYCN